MKISHVISLADLCAEKRYVTYLSNVKEIALITDNICEI